jgi:hypothetical protein
MLGCLLPCLDYQSVVGSLFSICRVLATAPLAIFKTKRCYTLTLQTAVTPPTVLRAHDKFKTRHSSAVLRITIAVTFDVTLS